MTKNYRNFLKKSFREKIYEIKLKQEKILLQILVFNFRRYNRVLLLCLKHSIEMDLFYF